MTQQALTTTAPAMSAKRQMLTTVMDKVEGALKLCNPNALELMPALHRSVALAEGIAQIKEALTKEVCDTLFTPLQGSALGFRTDRDTSDKGPYPMGVVRECAIEALLRGFYLTGNEWNIIGENFYAAKNGVERLVKQYPGLSNFILRLGVPVMAGEKGAIVAAEASWTLNGVPGSLVCDNLPRTNPDGSPMKDADGKTIMFDERIPIRVNAGMGADAILGKATRKMYKRVLDKVSGVDNDIPDGDVMDTEGYAVGEGPRAQTGAQAAAAAMTAKHKEQTAARNGESKSES